MITDTERSALRAVLHHLQAGTFVDLVPPPTDSEVESEARCRPRTAKLGFDMTTSGHSTPPRACIGGWMFVAMSRPTLDEPTMNIDAMGDYVFETRSPALEPFFSRTDLTVATAILAIEEFLNAAS